MYPAFDYDVLIIGGGPIGLACGIEAQKIGLSHIIIEKGCLVNSIYHYPANMTFFSTSDKIELGGLPFVSNNDRPNRREALEYYRRVKDFFNLNVHTYETAHTLNPITGGYRVATSRNVYRVQAVVLATGFYTQPNLLHIPGEELPKVKHFFDDPHLYSGQQVVVVGGGNSAIDAALETYRKGAQVTLVVRQNTLKEGVKYWIKPDIENRMKEGSIKAFFNSCLTHIYPDAVTITTPQGNLTLPNDFVLAMTGFHPDFDWLTQLGICLHQQPDGHVLPVFNDKTLETNLPGVYAAGTICGGTQTNKWYIENSRYHAQVVMSQIAGALKSEK